MHLSVLLTVKKTPRYEKMMMDSGRTKQKTKMVKMKLV